MHRGTCRCIVYVVQVHAPRDRNRLDYKGLVFYFDTIHPDGVTGHRWGLGLVGLLVAVGSCDMPHDTNKQVGTTSTLCLLGCQFHK